MSSERVEGMDPWRRGVLGTFDCASLGTSSSLDNFATSLPDRKRIDTNEFIIFMRALFLLHE